MRRGVREMDMEEVNRAVALLRESGYAVDSIGPIEHRDTGVEFDLSLFAASRSTGFNQDDDASNPG
jgi:hypothetical protein